MKQMSGIGLPAGSVTWPWSTPGCELWVVDVVEVVVDGVTVVVLTGAVGSGVLGGAAGCVAGGVTRAVLLSAWPVVGVLPSKGPGLPG